MAKRVFYSCFPAQSNMGLDGARRFMESAWAGEGYDRRKDAEEHRRFFEKTFGVVFVIEKYNEDGSPAE